MLGRMNLSMPTVSNDGGVTFDASTTSFTGRARFVFHLSAVSIIRIIQGR
jgi:hypothetical protein